MINVLFVCLGNICRSPMAEAVFNDKVRQLRLEDHLSSDSAGTSRYHIGSQPDPRTLDTLEAHSINHRHAARQAVTTDANNFKYILAMDHANFEDLKDTLPDDFEGLFLMRSFDEIEKDADVPDPYFGGNDGFEQVYQILDRSITAFIQFVRDKHHF